MQVLSACFALQGNASKPDVLLADQILFALTLVSFQVTYDTMWKLSKAGVACIACGLWSRTKTRIHKGTVIVSSSHVGWRCAVIDSFDSGSFC